MRCLCPLIPLGDNQLHKFLPIYFFFKKPFQNTSPHKFSVASLLLALEESIPCRPAFPYPSTACCCSTEEEEKKKGDADAPCIYSVSARERSRPSSAGRGWHHHSGNHLAAGQSCVHSAATSQCVPCPLPSNPRSRSDDGSLLLLPGAGAPGPIEE